MATFQLFFQLGWAKDLSAPLYEQNGYTTEAVQDVRCTIPYFLLKVMNPLGK